MSVSLKTAKIVGNMLGIDFNKIPLETFQMGMNVEMEHGKINKLTNVTDNDPVKTGKIALAHLLEAPDYYERLEKMEEEAKIKWNKYTDKEKYNMVMKEDNSVLYSLIGVSGVYLFSLII